LNRFRIPDGQKVEVVLYFKNMNMALEEDVHEIMNKLARGNQVYRINFQQYSDTLLRYSHIVDDYLRRLVAETLARSNKSHNNFKDLLLGELEQQGNLQLIHPSKRTRI
jgi:hypothetical protein